MPISLHHVNLVWGDILARNPRLTVESLTLVLQAVAEENSSVDEIKLPEIITAWEETRDALRALTEERLSQSLPESDDNKQLLEGSLAMLRARHLFLRALYNQHEATHPLAVRVFMETDKALSSAHAALRALEQDRGIPVNRSLEPRIFADQLPFEFVTGEPPVRLAEPISAQSVQPIPSVQEVVSPETAMSQTVSSLDADFEGSLGFFDAGGVTFVSDDPFVEGPVASNGSTNDSGSLLNRALQQFLAYFKREKKPSTQSFMFGLLFFAHGDVLDRIDQSRNLLVAQQELASPACTRLRHDSRDPQRYHQSPHRSTTRAHRGYATGADAVWVSGGQMAGITTTTALEIGMEVI